MKRGPKPKPAPSRREVEILSFMYFGLTNKEIGVALVTGEVMIKREIQNLTRRAGLHNRTRIVTHALERGWLTLATHNDGTGYGGSPALLTTPDPRAAGRRPPAGPIGQVASGPSGTIPTQI